MRRSESEELKKRLRKIFLLSADVLPDEVLAYMRKVETGNDWGAIEQVRDEFRPLIDSFPREYADYFLNNLIRNADGIDDDFQSSFSDHNLGISEHTDFFPPSPSQGPFLYLLRKNEDEGLRLIHNLSNYATKYWRERDNRAHVNNGSYTRLPIKVAYGPVNHEFWGDNMVYSWFRPAYNGPDSVSSALMALEVWMEEQIESGRDAEDLFAKVLNWSECVAVPGVCIAITLEYPEVCLKAALPLVGQPIFWRMDIARFTGDSGGASSVTNFGGYAGKHEIHLEVLNERNKRPQRKLEIRSLAWRYLFSKDEELSKSFSDAVAQFSIDLPFYWEEEKHSPERIAEIKEDMELLQVYGVRDNFRFSKDEQGSIWVQPEQPQHIRERVAADNKEMYDRMLAMQVWMWAIKSLKEEKLSDTMEIEQAYLLAKEYHSTILFPDTFELYNFTDHHLEALIGVSAVILFLGNDWLENTPNSKQEIINWCRSILLQTIKIPVNSGLHERNTSFLFHPKAAAALGLTSLLIRGIATSEEKEQLIRLIGNEHVVVASAVFRGLSKAWVREPIICWIALSLGVNIASTPKPERLSSTFLEWEDDPYEMREQRERNRVNDLVERHLEYLRKDFIPEIPKIPPHSEIILLVDLLSSIIQHLPTSDLLNIDSAKTKFLTLHDELLAWTIIVNSPKENESEPYMYDSWNDDFFNWATKLFKSFSNEETHTHLFVPLRETFPVTQKLTADLLKNYAYNRLDSYEPLSPDSLEEWKYICAWVLEHRRSNAGTWNIRRNRSWESLNAIIFVWLNRCIWNKTWPHVGLFVSVIREWVELVGHEPRRASMLLIMLDVLWVYIEPSQIISWVSYIVDSTGDVKELWETNENGLNIANLLGKLWSRNEDKIKTGETLKSYSKIVDSLVNFGIPSARSLQENLEISPKK